MYWCCPSGVSGASGARGGLLEQEISASITVVTAPALNILDLLANREILSSRLSLRV